MIFSKNNKQETQELEQILLATIENPILRDTAIEAVKTLHYLGDKYQNPLRHPINYLFKRDGMTIYIGHDPKTSPLHINGKEAVHLTANYSIHDPKGKKQLEDILRQHKSKGKKKGNDGAVEMTIDGRILSYRRMFKVEPDQVAAQYGVIPPGEEEASSEDWEFAEPVGMRHKSVKASVTIDRKVIMVTMSEETGKIRVFYDAKIMHSPIKKEIHSEYLKILEKAEEPASPQQINHAPTAPNYAHDMHTPHVNNGEELASLRIRMDALKSIHYYTATRHAF